MLDSELNYPVLLLLIGGVTILTIFLKNLFGKIKIPPLVAYILLGFLLKTADSYFGFLSGGMGSILEFFGKIGLITLLFLIGLESDLKGLLKQFKNAWLIWILDFTINALGGFALAYYLLGLDFIPSLFIGVGFMATSVGISVGTWKDMQKLDTPKGNLLIDIAELDDISGIVGMTMLFTIISFIQNSGEKNPGLSILLSLLFIFIKILLFGLGCFLFSKYFEGKLGLFLKKLNSPPESMLVVAAIGFIIAALADLIGFSLAIGAFFAGLVFSRDSDVVKMEQSFIPIYDMFSPFFFISIGLFITIDSVMSALFTGLLLTLAAIALKITAVGLPALKQNGPKGSLLLGVSMIPRAEILMIIIHHGLSSGYISQATFSAMVLVAVFTCLITPLSVGFLFNRGFYLTE